MITVLTCRGTGEPLGSPHNMLASVTSKLDPAKYQIGADVDYPADVGPANAAHGLGGCSEQQSIQLGVRALAQAIRDTPNQVGVLGYSLGAEVVTRFLEAKAGGEYSDCELVWAANIANPLRREGDSLHANPVGFGINGQHGPWPDDVLTFEVANPADGITSCPADSPLRTLADSVSAFSFAELGGWTMDLADRLRRNRWQLATFDWWLHPLCTWSRWSQAAAMVDGYLFGGTHTRAYQDFGYCTRLAAVLNVHG
ncbi:PE-PPE domain-containing protein [Nocardia nepalensis]|uniref:PE-PPE domain-containing protein n=1 Tax=Nocardia nepalensis TaxID=3375448 RepID=UPI003B673A38